MFYFVGLAGPLGGGRELPFTQTTLLKLKQHNNVFVVVLPVGGGGLVLLCLPGNTRNCFSLIVTTTSSRDNDKIMTVFGVKIRGNENFIPAGE